MDSIIDPLVTVIEQLLAEHGLVINGEKPTREEVMALTSDILRAVIEFKRGR